MLTPRLNCILKYVNCNTAADIGTDHAYVPIELIKTGRAKKVIAADINKGPLDIAVSNIKKNSMEEKIEARLGSGLSVLKPGEADVIIIAGMGGELICEIIKSNMDIAKKSKLVIQPMNEQYELRKFLHNNGFSIECEDIECEGHRVYNILVVKNGEQESFKYDIEYHIPMYLKKNKNFKYLYEKKYREFNKIINGLSNSNNCDTEKLLYYKESLENLKKYED